jgi:hypothetical protein
MALDERDSYLTKEVGNCIVLVTTNT